MAAAASEPPIDPLIEAISSVNVNRVLNSLRFPQIDKNHERLTIAGSEDPKDFKTPLKHAMDEYIKDPIDGRLRILKSLFNHGVKMSEDEYYKVKAKYENNEYEDYLDLGSLLKDYFYKVNISFFKDNQEKFGEQSVTSNVVAYSPGGGGDGGGSDGSEETRENKRQKKGIPKPVFKSGGRGKIKKKTRKSKRSKRSKRSRRSKRSKRSRKN